MPVYRASQAPLCGAAKLQPGPPSLLLLQGQL